MNIFESAVHKLTAWYVGALFLVCLTFSIPTYVVTADRLERGAARQAEILQEVGWAKGQLTPRIGVLRDQQIRRDRQQLLRTIVLANLAILVAGAYFSFQFAKNTLKPIEEAHKAQARFATDASHELRTPLAVMQAEIEVALRGKSFNADQAKDVLTSNLEEIARLQILGDQLLGLARLDSDRLQIGNVSLSKIIAAEIKSLEKRHHIQITQTIAKSIKVSGDDQLLRQLVAILVDNAVKYAGDSPPDIHVALTKKDANPQISVTDRGIGIRASELPRIFDRFFRGSSATTHSPDGHGLGLSLAKRIVDAHGGAISVTSQPGKSTTFEIKLPT